MGNEVSDTGFPHTGFRVFVPDRKKMGNEVSDTGFRRHRFSPTPVFAGFTLRLEPFYAGSDGG